MNGICFDKTGLSVTKEDSIEIYKKKVIEHGPFVSIGGDIVVFLVFVFWIKDYPGNSKSGKWFPSINGDNPSWTFLANQLKSYTIGGREIVFGHNDELTIKEYGLPNDNDVEDAENVHQSYRLVKLSEIRGLIFKIDI